MPSIIIIGSGPAGISAALYAVRAGVDTTVLTKGPGALDRAEKIENYYGFAQPVSGAELEAAIRRGILMKPARHRMDETGVTETHRGMFAIGG